MRDIDWSLWDARLDCECWVNCYMFVYDIMLGKAGYIGGGG